MISSLAEAVPVEVRKNTLFNEPILLDSILKLVTRAEAPLCFITSLVKASLYCLLFITLSTLLAMSFTIKLVNKSELET